MFLYSWVIPQGTSASLQVPFEGPRWEVAVACTTLAASRSDWLVEKCAELGAFALRPLITARSVPLGDMQTPA